MPTKQRPANTGVITGRRPTDFVAGSLPYEVRNPSGDWSAYVTKYEKQYSDFTDTMACVSFSCNHSIEIQMKFLTGQEINLSNRWLAKQSGTTMAGNYLSLVADTVRLDGAVPESAWPDPGNYTWEQYYADIPLEIRKQGADFLKNWNVAYEWVDVSSVIEIKKALLQAPLQVIIPGHAVVEIMNLDDYYKYFDTYPNFIKQGKQNGITDALKIVLTRKVQPMEIVNDNGAYHIVGELGKLSIADPATLAKFKQITAQERSGNTASVPTKGIVSHDDAFIIHN